MKISSVLLCLAAVLVLASCSEDDSSDSSEKDTSSIPAVSQQAEESSRATEEPSSYAFDSYALPADVVSPDLTADDPTDENITFKYDDTGRVQSYKYMQDSNEVIVTYTYSDDGTSVSVLVFVGESVAAAQEFTLPEYNKDTGFSVHNGYFFKGYVF